MRKRGRSMERKLGRDGRGEGNRNVAGMRWQMCW